MIEYTEESFMAEFHRRFAPWRISLRQDGFYHMTHYKKRYGGKFMGCPHESLFPVISEWMEKMQAEEVLNS